MAESVHDLDKRSQGAKLRVLTAHVKFHQIYTLIGSFCWKYIKFQLKKYREVKSHDTEEWCEIWIKTDLFQKWQEFGEFWPKHSKVSQICTLIGSYCAKYLMFDVKKYRGVISWNWRVMQNLRKSYLWFGKWHEENGKFYQSTGKCQNWDFYETLLSKL